MSAPEPRRVLIAEDVRTIAQSLAGILESEGYEVAVAADGEATLEMARDFHPHLILLDLIMPKIHGMEVLRRLREMEGCEGVGVILSTTKEFDADWRHAEEMGVTGQINKPTTRSQLLSEVQRFFDSSTAARKVESGEGTEPSYAPKLNSDRGIVRMWGTRGSIPVSGPSYQQYGGNTSCMEFDTGREGEVLIFDAGSGIRELGSQLAAMESPLSIHLFVTHTHWDHIQGFPFFAPLYDPGTKVTIYGDRGFGKNLESIFRGQFARDYFPIQWDDFRASVEFVYLGDEPVEVGEVCISRAFVNHPGATIGYRMGYRGHTTVFIPDDEFLKGYTGPPERKLDYQDLLVTHRSIIDFVEGADLLIHEAQFLNEEYSRRIGWGHSSLSNACVLAVETAVKEWLVTHHDPSHDDEFLNRKLALTCQLLDQLDCGARVSHAYDGLAKWLG